MKLSGWTLDHVAHAVFDIDQHLPLYTDHFGFAVRSDERLEEHKVRAVFLDLGTSALELISPLPGNQTVKGFLEKRGEGLHHLCFRVENLESELRRVEALGIKLIDAAPRPGAHNTEVAFLHPKSTGNVLIELCSERKAVSNTAG